MMLCVGSSGLRMFCTKKRSSPVRPIKSLRVSVGGCEPCESVFLTKGIVGTSLVCKNSSELYKPSVRLYYKLQHQALVIKSYYSIQYSKYGKRVGDGDEQAADTRMCKV